MSDRTYDVYDIATAFEQGRNYQQDRMLLRLGCLVFGYYFIKSRLRRKFKAKKRAAA